MSLNSLLSLIRDLPAYRHLMQEVREGQVEEGLSLLRAARPYVVAALAQDLAVPVVLIEARPDQVGGTVEQLRQWLPQGARVLRFSEPESLPYERIPWSTETVRERLSVISALAQWQEDEGRPGAFETRSAGAPVIVTSARALMQRTIPRREFVLGSRTLRHGQSISLSKMLALWLELGYEMVSVVEEPGTFSRRGGIVDIFPADATEPARIELFGDEIDSLRAFDPATQRSLHRLDSLTIPPASEALPRHGSLAVQKLAQLDDSTLHAAAKADYRSDLECLENRQHFRGIEFYVPYLYSQPGTLLDYLPQQGLLVVDDFTELKQTIGDLEAEAVELRGSLEKSGELLPGYALPYVTWDEFLDTFADRLVLNLGYDQQADWLEVTEEALEDASPALRLEHTSASEHRAEDGDETVGSRATDASPGLATDDVVPESPRLGAHFAAGQRYGGQLKRVMEAWSELLRAGRRVAVVSRQAQRLAELWSELGERVKPVDTIPAVPPRRSLTLVQDSLDEGWTLRLSDQASLLEVFTDAEIFGWNKPRPRHVRRKQAAPEVFYADLNPGDYVVHMDFGIGVYRGLVKATIDGAEREYLRVDYEGEDTLYVPVHHADRLGRYVGATGQAPTLHRLGTTDWARVKEQAKKAAVDVAKELLELYSARQVVPGFAFPQDSEWQQELEASFPYIETDDQMQAILEAKADMEKDRPMDRLVCGDVGYGKTEVALRAAFKAVMGGKQVAVLVPTTVLAQQHFTTFRRRLAPFPVRVEMLSRFRTPREQREVVDGLATGAIDIVIGTHRLLSPDVRMKDLGLLVIDEEQRFGVTHKERLKQMRTEVDVLTMTATPIPRTLYMSLTGVRDMSTIETAPEERLSIKTQVGQYDEALIRKAILRELDRGGQVFFVHNRVRGIEQIRRRLEHIVSEASYAVGHGQMPERELERVMVDFAEGNIDVLVCTTIIESGLDIPNANTIIVNRADQFGLAQLYQLRGRVGRGANRAYAYFLYGRSAGVTETARKRLQAILEASDLGAGFSIAMRDLEIRGAGELLGTRQHGHIAAVGFDLYCRLLAQAVSELKGEAPHTLTSQVPAYVSPLEHSVQITLPLDASLPADYVPDEALRLQLYRRLAGLSSLDEIDAIGAELQDRFGALPLPATNLLYQLRVKVIAQEGNVDSIISEHRTLVVRSAALEQIDRHRLKEALGASFDVRRREIRLPMGHGQSWQSELLRALDELRKLRQP